MTTIYVTQDHIDNGKPRSVGGCPVALAVNDALNPTGEHPTCVSQYQILLLGHWEGEFPNAESPPEVGAFIAHFDAGRPVQPFSFDINIDIPEESK